MSICIGWIKNGKSYLIADDLLSSTQNITFSTHTPFLQSKELFNGYYVEEEGLKIYEISKDIAIAVAGDVPSYSEILQYIYQLKDSLSFHKLMEIIQQNFEHLLKNIEMLILHKKSGKNRIIVWNGQQLYETTDPSEPIFIGSALKI